MDQLENTITQFFTQLLGTQPELSITSTDDEINIHLQLEPQDSALLIGYRGEALQAIQLILSLILQQHQARWVPVRLDINDYREKRLEAIQNLAATAASKAIQTHKPVTLVDLTSYERRIVHTTLADNSQISTHSEGEPPHRVLVIEPAS